MLKKIFWIVVAVCVIFLVLINSHIVTFYYLNGRPLDLKLDLLLIVAFAAGILCMLISGFIGRSEEFFSNLSSYGRSRKRKKLEESYNEAISCIKLENHKRAKELLQGYLKEEINNIDAYLHLADIYIQGDELDDAKEVLKRAAVVSNNDVKILNRLCDVYLWLEKPHKAVKILEDIKESVQEKTLYNKKLFDIHFSENDYKKAYEVQKELEKDGSFNGLKSEFLITKYRLALEFIKADKFQQAERKLKSVIKSDKSFYSAYVDYAQALFKEKGANEAVDFLKSSYEETKSMVFAKLIEEIYLYEENPQEALSFYKSEIEKASREQKFPPVQSAPPELESENYLIIYALYISLLLKLEMIDYAIEAINDVMDICGGKKIFHLLIAECHLRHNDYEQSAKQYHEYLSSKSSHPVELRCGECQALYDDFTAECAGCGSYNTINYSIC